MLAFTTVLGFLGILLKYRIYFFLFEFSLYPTIRLYRKWKVARGRQQVEYWEKFEMALFISGVIYLTISYIGTYIFGLDKFREVVMMAVMAKIVFLPLAMMARWISARTIFRDDVVAYVKDRKDKGLLEMDVMVSVIPGTIIYFIMLPFALGAVTASLLFGLLVVFTYRDSLRVRGETRRLRLKDLWRDHGKFLGMVFVWFMIYLLVGGSSNMTYVLPLMVFIPIVISMDLNIRKHKILRASKVIANEKDTVD